MSDDPIWDVQAVVVHPVAEADVIAFSIRPGWEPFATTVGQTGTTRVWIRRRVV